MNVFHSGDLVRTDEDGFLYVVDRKKDMIISGGENIYAAELESVLESHPAVSAVAVVGVAHPRWGETPVAVVVKVPDREVNEQELIDLCREQLASYKKPSAVVFRDALPRNATAARDGTFTFYRPGGTAIPPSPPLPPPDGTIGDCHDADITPETIIPPWYGERLDLDYAIHVCFANARAERERQTRLQDGEAEARDRVTIYEAEDWDKRIRHYYDEHPRTLYRVVQSIPV
jgi:hypothetical protein